MALIACDDDPDGRDARPETADVEAPTHDGRWERLRGPAREARGFQEMTAVVVGDRVVVVAGVNYDQESVNVAVIDPGDRRWAPAQPSGIAWRYRHTVVAADDRVILWGGCCGGGARGSQAPGAIYDVGSDRWTPLDPGPLGNRFGHTAVWTGEEMIVWGGRTGYGEPDRLTADGGAYHPSSGTWRALPSAPIPPREQHIATWTGDEMIVWGGSRPSKRGHRILTDGAAYDPERDRWRAIAPAPMPRESRPERIDDVVRLSAAWTGVEMIVWGDGLGVAGALVGGALYEPDGDRWRPIPPVPVEQDAERPQLDAHRLHVSVWTGSELLIWGGMDERENDVAVGGAYDPEEGSWSMLPEAPLSARSGHVGDWTEDGMVIWGGFAGARHRSDGAVYVPER